MWSNHSQGKDDWLFGATLVANLWRDIQAIKQLVPVCQHPCSQLTRFCVCQSKKCLTGLWQSGRVALVTGEMVAKHKQSSNNTLGIIYLLISSIQWFCRLIFNYFVSHKLLLILLGLQGHFRSFSVLKHI